MARGSEESIKEVIQRGKSKTKHHMRSHMETQSRRRFLKYAHVLKKIKFNHQLAGETKPQVDIITK